MSIFKEYGAFKEHMQSNYFLALQSPEIYQVANSQKWLRNIK